MNMILPYGQSHRTVNRSYYEESEVETSVSSSQMSLKDILLLIGFFDKLRHI